MQEHLFGDTAGILKKSKYRGIFDIVYMGSTYAHELSSQVRPDDEQTPTEPTERGGREEGEAGRRQDGGPGVCGWVGWAAERLLGRRFVRPCTRR